MANYSNYEIKLNNIKNAEQLVTINRIPTILSINPTVTGGTKSMMKITLKGGRLNTFSNGDYFMKINDVTLHGTRDLNKAGNTYFYISPENSVQTNNGMAYYLCKALNNTKLSNVYNIYIDKQNTGETNCVIIEGREYGSEVPTIECNLPVNMFSYTTTANYVKDSLTDSKIIVDIYGKEVIGKTSEVGGDEHKLPFIAQLEKNYYKDGLSFDLSPLLGNHTNDGQLTEYNCFVSALDKDGNIASLGNATHNYCINGYMFKNGEKFFDVGRHGLNILLQNVSNGSNKDVLNKTDLYFIDNISFTILFYDNPTTYRFRVIHRNSALEEIKNDYVTMNVDEINQTFEFSPSLEETYYIDVVLEDIGVLRYQNIKPLKYGDVTNYENIYFYNSYGGVSFCPFTASQEEEYDAEVETYSPHHFDVYTNSNKVHKKKYINDVEEEITLKSHYMTKDGMHTYKELLYAYTAWIYDEDDNKIEIIVDDVSFEEIQHGIYQCTLKYKTKEIK